MTPRGVLGNPRKRSFAGSEASSAVFSRNSLNLGGLNLSGTRVTDAGLEHIKGITSLKGLELNSTHVTDAGLEHLKGMTNLKELILTDTQVTNARVNELKKALPKCKIER